MLAFRYKRPSQLCWALAINILALAVLKNSALATDAQPRPIYKVVKTISLKSFFKMRSDWSVSAYQANTADDLGSDPAKLCFVRPKDKHENCTKITSGMPNDPTFLFDYQAVTDLKVVTLKPGVSAILFHAQFSGGGSGTKEQISLWTYDPRSDWFWPALIVSPTGIGQYKVFNSGPLSGYVIVGDPEWQTGEPHFGAHQFHMTVYRLTGLFYLEVLSYLAKQKYSVSDDDNSYPSDAIDGELPQIRTLLKSIGQ
jgi:hypothetical protein